MQLHGQSIIAGRVTPTEGAPFSASHATQGTPLTPQFYEASPTLADAALREADNAFDALRESPPEQRAAFLDAFATKIEALGDSLLERAHAETALPMARLTAERTRLTGQARMFAALIREGSWLEARIDHGLPDRTPQPKPDIRRVMVPIGPVVVFGASNFPFAISVAGTDTVSALAAGCPVVTKAHPGHPGTCEMVATALMEALSENGLPPGAFSMLHGKGYEIGLALVKHPLAAAVAFTGSLRGGRALHDAAVNRPNPIPFYGELGSVNPVFLLPGALAENSNRLASGFVQSLTMGTGQYCTNPGLVFAVANHSLDQFESSTAAQIQAWPPAAMLHEGIAKAFHAGLQRLDDHAGVERVARSSAEPASEWEAPASLFRTQGRIFSADASLREEIFGPVSLITHCDSREELERIAESLAGQLTASIHGTVEDLKSHTRLIRILERKVGRLIFNGYGTGIEVCPSMHHGGPYPATTHSHFTSIGTAAIYRFVRPVCYQGFPDECLPAALQEGNLTGAWRLVDGMPSRQ